MSFKLWRLCLTFLGIAAFVLASMTLEDELGIPFDTTLRIACAAACLAFIYQLSLHYPGQRWPWIGFWAALLVNVGIFLTPLVDQPASRGELMLFAMPDAIVVLAVRTATYSVADDHQRAVRGQLILGLILAAALCAIIFSIDLMHPRKLSGTISVPAMRSGNHG